MLPTERRGGKSRGDARPYAGSRIVTHRGRPLVISGRDLPAGTLDHAVDYFEARDRGEGPAAQMMWFVAPLLDAAGHDAASRERALSLGTTFWNLALCDDEPRDRTLDEIVERLGDDERKVENFRMMGADMIERHRRCSRGCTGDADPPEETA